jgi:hypothetical protein
MRVPYYIQRHAAAQLSPARLILLSCSLNLYLSARKVYIFLSYLLLWQFTIPICTPQIWVKAGMYVQFSFSDSLQKSEIQNVITHQVTMGCNRAESCEGTRIRMAGTLGELQAGASTLTWRASFQTSQS